MFKSTRNKIVSIIIACAMLVGIFALAEAIFPDSKLIFKGITMQAADDGSIQAFVDIKLSDIEGTSLGFKMKYDSDYIEPSRVSDNKPLQWTDFVSTASLSIDEENFPAGSLLTTVFFNEAEKTIEVTFTPDQNYVSDGTSQNEYIIDSEQYREDGKPIKIINAKDQPVVVARMSFNVKDPSALAQLTNFQQILSIPRDLNSENEYHIGYIDVDSSVFPDEVTYSQNEHLGFEFDLQNPVVNVTTNVQNPIVSADKVYNVGKVNNPSDVTEEFKDLIDYANSHYQDLTVTYASGASFADVITWGDLSKNFDCTSTASRNWDPKGGGKQYHLFQKYNDDITVHLYITVESVTVDGYITENDYIAYEAPNIPTSIDDMDMPVKADIVFDKLVNGTYSVNIEETAWSSIPSDFASGIDGEYDFTADVKDDEFPAWATVPDDKKTVTVVRAIGTRTESPVVTAETDDDGVMTIVISSIGGSGVQSGTEFVIRMPNGMTIDQSWFDNTSSDTYMEGPNFDTPLTGQAQIKIAVSAGDADENANLAILKKYINLGNRADSEFELAAKAGGNLRSEWVPFSLEARNNVYKPSDSADGNYVFDYSKEECKNLISYNISQADVPNTIRLPAFSEKYYDDTDSKYKYRQVEYYVPTTYSGIDGAEPGMLSTITVKDWNIPSSPSVGDVIEITGVLEDATYADYGEVKNPQLIEVTLKLIVTNDIINENIKHIEDFVFDTQQVNYGGDKLQTEQFDIVNTTVNSILGLTVSISGDGANAFALRANPAYVVNGNSQVSFSIGTRPGLPVGEYTAEVTVGSSKTAVLDRFNITFKVVAEEVYSVSVTTNNPLFGTANVVGSRNYRKDDVVKLKAVPNTDDDCAFERWEIITGPQDLIFTQNASDLTEWTFIMPDTDVELEAIFSDSPAAQLRLSSLKVLNYDEEAENNIGSENALRDNSTGVLLSAFSPTTREYMVVVPSLMEKNMLEFVVDPIYIEGEPVNVKEVVRTVPGAAASDNVPLTQIGNPYTTDWFELSKDPSETIVEIKLEVTIDGTSYNKSYTIHIHRELEQSERASFDFGNSPYGLIMQDSAIDETAKEAAKEAFVSNGNKYGAGYIPAGIESGTENIHYVSDAWGRGREGVDYINYDKDDEAVFVYNSADSVRLPGIKELKDAIGNAVEDYTKVKVSISVNTLNTGTPPADLYSYFSSFNTQTLTASCDSDGVAVITGISGLRIRPDVYMAEYSYANFDGSVIKVMRPVIILPSNGDVNIDGTNDTSDAGAIRSRYIYQLPYESMPGYEAGGRLYKYRVCDANVDGDVNNADARKTVSASPPQKFYTDLPQE